MQGAGRVTIGALAGGAVAAIVAPRIKHLFSAVDGGVGVLTVYGYPKGWDYAVVALLTLGSLIGGALLAWSVPRMPPVRDSPPAEVQVPRRWIWAAAALVFGLMIFVHDHPFVHMDPFHEGEHLTPGWLFTEGERPFSDVFLLHGLATDGGLDALVMGESPSPLRTRRLQTVLDAIVLGLLVFIAAELVSGRLAFVMALTAGLCGTAAFIVPVFPWFRLAPVLLSTLALLRYLRRGGAGALMLAFASATLGVLWSLDTGTYALAGTAGAFAAARVLGIEARPLGWSRVAGVTAVALVLPFAVLLAIGASPLVFLRDSFLAIPSAIDAVWALPAPAPFTAAGVRYYAPPLFYGLLLALTLLAWRRGHSLLAGRMATVALMSIFLFRTAAGRVSWSHTRFAVPLLGIAVVAFVLEPLFRDRRWRWAGAAVAVPLVFYFEPLLNATTGWKLLSEWPARQEAPGLVPHPLQGGHGIFTSEQNATELATLAGYVSGLPDGPMFDFANERALYYLLGRKPATRCFDVPMLSSGALLREAMAELKADPPVFVITAGEPALGAFDGVSNRERVPELAAWIDRNYPTRTRIGRFEVATPAVAIRAED